MRYDLVIFDCDGVLVDSEPLANRTLSRCFQDAGFPISYEDCCTHMIGLSLRSCFAMAEEWHAKPVPDDLLDAVRHRTREAIQAELRPVPGARVAVTAAAGRCCVASSSDPAKLRLSLDVTGLLPLFAGHVFSAAEVARGKPAPDLFLHAASRMQAAPERCVVIEDSRYGVQAARAAGMAVMGYVGGSFAADLAAEGATVFEEMAALPNLLSLA